MQKKKFRHLRRAHRDAIHRMKQGGKTQAEIARTIGLSQSTVSRELSRNRGQRGYRPKQADGKAAERRLKKKRRPRVITGAVEEEVISRLKRKQTPELISGAMRRKRGHGPSHEAIYQYVAADKERGGDLHKNLPINGKRRYRRRCRATRSKSKIPNRVDIDQRPKTVDSRARYGDWEADLIEGAKGSGFVLSLHERKSRLVRLHKLPNKGAQATAEGIAGLLAGLKVRTITYDNGPEFARHEQVSLELGARAYFCKPYHSWEKGAVENSNRLVRMWLPKATSFEELDNDFLKQIENEINHRPKKVLGFRTPIEYEKKLAA